MSDDYNAIAMPVGRLGIIGMAGTEEITAKVDSYLVKRRAQREEETSEHPHFAGYCRDTYKIRAACPRFATGEAKGELKESARGLDLYILVDVFNYSVTYQMYGRQMPMSPDDHFQDLKRVIAAAGEKTKRISVIMPLLYEGRQHKRSTRESLDCALCLQELANMGVQNIITFDAHDPRVQNAIPLKSFESIQPTYQFIKALVNEMPDICLDSDHLMVISPDEGGIGRSMYSSSVLGVQLGMFYKRRDYAVIINGRNPIIAHEFLGNSVEGKDLMIIDDMISTGDSMLDVARQLKDRGAKRIFVCASFGLFTDGLEKFDQAYEEGVFTKVFTTNLTYRSPELKAREWYSSVDMSKFIAYIIDNLNHDYSISAILNPVSRIKKLLNGLDNR